MVFGLKYREYKILYNLYCIEMKILVIGYSGSGKSTVSKTIADAYNLPLLYLDCVHFLPKWEKRDAIEEKKIVSDFMTNNDKWVIDGNYFDVLFEERLKEADKIVLLDFGRLTCLYRAYKRSIEYKDKERESMNPECDEIMDAAFIKHILIDRKDERKIYKDIINKYENKMVIIDSQKKLDRLYSDIRGGYASISDY